MPQIQTRRNFLKTAMLGGAAIALTACGGAQQEADFPVLSLGDASKSKRVLIAYASLNGSTADTAARMGETLAKHGLAVDVQPAKTVKDLSAYDAVMLGSGIRAGRPQNDALKFVKTHKDALKAKPFYAFYLCITLEKDTPENRKGVEPFKDPVRAVAAPKSDAVFAGVIDPSKLDFIEKLMVKAFNAPSGDFRKWDEINAWLDGLALG